MRFGILGAGNWGSIFSIMLVENGYTVNLWEYDRRRAANIAQTRINQPFLVGKKIPAEISVTSNINEVIENSDILVLAIPSQAVSEVTNLLPDKLPILSLVKGIDIKQLRRISELLTERINPELIAVLSGPCIANEVKDHNPTSVVIASYSNALAEKLQEMLSSDYFRVYRSNDVIGVEIGGTYKNTIAIACGIVDGLGFGNNAKAALISRGLVEMKRFADELGAMPETIYGLAGLGDMITTSFSVHSRNRRLGEGIGGGKTPQAVIAEIVMVAEGYYSTPALINLSEKLEIELPIAHAINLILHHGFKPLEVVEDLMSRPLKPEGE